MTGELASTSMHETSTTPFSWQSTRIELTWLPVWPQAPGLWPLGVILTGLYKLIKIDRRNRGATIP